MTREQKLALIVGFSLILFVGVLISDHLSSARRAKVAKIEPEVAQASPISVSPIPAPGPAPETHAAAPGSARDPLELIISSTPEPLPAATPGTIAAAPPAGQAGTPAPESPRGVDTALAEEIKRLGGDLIQGTDGQPTFSLPTAASLVPGNPATSPAPEIVPVTRPGAIETKAGPIEPVKTHIVRSGETLFQITARYYGNGNYWRELAKFNNMDKAGTIRLGSRIRVPSKDVLLSRPVAGAAQGGNASPRIIPPAERAVAPRTAPKAAPVPERGKARVELASYTVRRGDTLGEISLRTLGTSRRWQEIADLNNLDDEDAIAAGTVLKIPARRS